jgi:Spy/CpxP family protein refolding chaperone
MTTVVANSLLKYLFTILILAVCASAFGQTSTTPTEEELLKVESMKVGIITAKLNLSPEQAKEFWPLYNDYNVKKKQNRKTMKALLASTGTLSEPLVKNDEEKSRENIKKYIALRQLESNLEAEYTEKFLKIIKPSQMLKLYCAEKEVMKLLLKQMGQPKPAAD